MKGRSTMAGRLGTAANPIVINLKERFTADDLGTAIKGKFRTIEGLHPIPGESHVLIKNAGRSGSLGPMGVTQPTKKPTPKKKTKVAAKKSAGGKKP
jgi:hypothetical protein